MSQDRKSKLIHPLSRESLTPSSAFEMPTPLEVEWLLRKAKEGSDFARREFAKDKVAKGPSSDD